MKKLIIKSFDAVFSDDKLSIDLIDILLELFNLHNQVNDSEIILYIIIKTTLFSFEIAKKIKP